MLTKEAKRYIEENVKELQEEIEGQESSIHKLQKKIENLDKFLEIESEKPNYQEKIIFMVEELENATKGNKLSFLKMIKIEDWIEMIEDLMEVPIDRNLQSFLRQNNIIRDDQILQKLFLEDESNLGQDFIERIKEYLKSIKKEQYLPYAKVFFLNKNSKEFQKLENNQLPIYQYWDYTSNLFFVYLELVYKKKDRILEKYTNKVLHIEEYLEEIIERYENKVNFKYIPSSVIKIDEEDGLEEDNNIPFIEINDNSDLKKMKLIGYAGAGKTTTLEYIEYKDAKEYEKNQKIPVIVSLITVEKEEEIEDIIARKLKLVESSENNKVMINDLIQKKKINLYFDGINEISIQNPYSKKQFLNHLEEFITKDTCKEIKIIVTDRDNSEVSVLNNAPTFLIQGMKDQEIEEFIEGNTKEENIEKVKEEIKKNERFLEKLVQPLMLKSLITIIECDGKIPENEEELSEAYLDSVITREIEEKHDSQAKYIDGALTYMVKQISLKEGEWTVNIPTSYFRVMDIFNQYGEEENLPDLDAEYLLNLIKKMGILKEVEYEKYAFTDENFFHCYYYKAISL